MRGRKKILVNESVQDFWRRWDYLDESSSYKPSMNLTRIPSAFEVGLSRKENSIRIRSRVIQKRMNWHEWIEGRDLWANSKARREVTLYFELGFKEKFKNMIRDEWGGINSRQDTTTYYVHPNDGRIQDSHLLSFLESFFLVSSFSSLILRWDGNPSHIISWLRLNQSFTLTTTFLLNQASLFLHQVPFSSIKPLSSWSSIPLPILWSLAPQMKEEETEKFSQVVFHLMDESFFLPSFHGENFFSLIKNEDEE